MNASRMMANSRRIGRVVSKKRRRQGTLLMTSSGHQKKNASFTASDYSSGNDAENDVFFDYDPLELRLELIRKRLV